MALLKQCHSFLPQIDHISWDTESLVSRAVEWITQFSRGNHKREAMFTDATFIEGGTIEPVRR